MTIVGGNISSAFFYISSQKVLFRVQVMKRKRKKLTNLKKVSQYLFISECIGELVCVGGYTYAGIGR